MFFTCITISTSYVHMFKRSLNSLFLFDIEFLLSKSLAYRVEGVGHFSLSPQPNSALSNYLLCLPDNSCSIANISVSVNLIEIVGAFL